MNGNFTQQLPMDSQEIQQVMQQVLAETLRTVPKPVVPSWMQATGDFIKIHPWLSFFIILLILLFISLIIREIICSYLKTNEILKRLKRLEDKL